MDTLVHPVELSANDNRTGLCKLHPPAPSYEAKQAEVGMNDNAAIARSFQLPHRLAEDAHGSHLVNVPFAFTVFMILAAGLVAVGLGITVTNAWLAGVGFLTALIGCFLYGWSLHDD